MIYTTKDGDRLDIICQRYYGKTDGVVETVLYDPANYDLATTEIFNAGTVINLPAISAADIIQPQEEHVLWE
ncbi:phage tail protein [Pantoea agglomerans]|nr:tail protein X [Pantoea agglomerans]NEG58175.1 phage tail protein [Pantoea agglomerans]NEG99888.1 phage tail protein [Pantoea agglomerans]NEH04149.1 phage tail protein [Pantoea agglomerans]NEH14448.1 phage tail protein [Pantoea agglomerans]